MPTKKTAFKSSKSVSDTLKVLRKIQPKKAAVNKGVSNGSAASIPNLSNLRKKRSYSVRDLPIKQTGSFANLVNRIEKESDKLDKLLKPGEYWGAEIVVDKKTNKARTFELYENLDLLMQKLSRYQEFAELGNKRKATDDLIKKIRIVKFGAAAPEDASEKEIERIQKKNRRDWLETKKVEVEKREEKKRELAKEISSGRKAKRKLKSTTAKAKKLSKQLTEKKRKEKKLEKDLEQIKKKLAAANKKLKTVSKKAAKKTKKRK